MQKNICRFTVYFEAPFWVGVFERCCGGALEACKITFGTEPKDNEVYAFLLEHWPGLRFSPPVGTAESEARRPNPKRMQREVQKQLDTHGTGTKSQQALSLQREANKAAAKRQRRQSRDEEAQRQYELRAKKRKEKHRGR